MRRYQLSGLEHIHMMRHVPRSYDMTRTHILHRSVNRHVDVVLKCSPKNWKKKKVTVSVVKGEKKNEIVRIRSNAKKGYVAVRKRPVNEEFEADRKRVVAAYTHETKYGAKNPASGALIHDMKSQISAMAQKSADYIDEQLNAKPVLSYSAPAAPAAPVEQEQRREEAAPLLSPESEAILRKGGYRVPTAHPSNSYAGNPYAANYLMHASNEEFHYLMDSLEKSLDEACRKYAVEPVEPKEAEEPAASESVSKAEPVEGFSDYYGGYSAPNNISLSVTNKQKVAPEKPQPEEEKQALPAETENSPRPALDLTDSGELFPHEDELFERELDRPREGGYVPPAYFFDDDETAPAGAAGEDYVPMPDPAPVPVTSEPQKQEIFRIEPDEPSAPETPHEGGYPHEDYEQQQVFLQSDKDAHPVGQLYNPPQEEEDFAEPTLYSDQSHPEEENGYEPHMVFPDEDDDLPPPMIFPDDGEEDEGYSPAPVSPDRNEDFDDSQGVINRTGTMYSRSGERVKKVIGVIKGEPRMRKREVPVRNRNVEIVYSDRGRRNK